MQPALLSLSAARSNVARHLTHVTEIEAKVTTVWPHAAAMVARAQEMFRED